MSILFKYSPVFALWMAGFGLCGHMTIIHDHHSETNFVTQHENCPAAEKSNDHHAGSPIHCHAFNDVAAEKAVPYQFQSVVQCNDLILSLSENNFVFVTALFRTLYPTPQTPYRNPHLRNFASLRAPPFV